MIRYEGDHIVAVLDILIWNSTFKTKQCIIRVRIQVLQYFALNTEFLRIG